MHRAHVIALDPTADQIEHFRKACGVSRFAYNWALAEWIRQYRAGLKPTALALKRTWNSVRGEQFPWSCEVTKCASAQGVLDVGKAFQNFFRAQKQPKAKAKYPRFKRRGKSRDSFAVWNDQIKLAANQIRLPGVGWVRTREELRFCGKLLGATVSRTADRWFVSLRVDISSAPPPQYTQQAARDIVGIDLGIKTLMTLSQTLEGSDCIENPKPLKKAQAYIRRLQRRLSRKRDVQKRKGPTAAKSRRHVKADKKLARAHARIANIRADVLHKATTKIASTFKTVVLEDLNNAGLLKNHCIARAVADASFGEIRRQLEYKTAARGGRVLVINRFQRSTGVCPGCGLVGPKLDLNVRTWECPGCHTQHDRDIAAAKVIEMVGAACPEPVSASSRTHGETSALAVAKAATKLKSVNRELQCVKPHRKQFV